VRVTVIEVIEALNRGGQMTVAEIVESTKMNVDTVRDTLATLSKAGWVYPCGLRGRVPGKMKAVVWKSAVHRSERSE
jgi:DNA-binding IclR family transcriptional regulator